MIAEQDLIPVLENLPPLDAPAVQVGAVLARQVLEGGFLPAEVEEMEL